jgi:transposase-like protein
MTATFQDPIFQDENKAREALEALRWSNSPVCPHCRNSDPETLAKIEGKKQSHRPGLWYCNECKACQPMKFTGRSASPTKPRGS